jgi:monoamine oxidase
MPTHTVIVGAGITGLWLADKLTAAGDTVTLLERNNYVGGRVYTRSKGDGEQYEIGAGRISYAHSRVSALIDRFGLTRIPLSPDLDWKADCYDPSLPNHFDPTWSAIATEIARLPPTTLATHTLRQLAARVLGSAAAADRLLARFPYRTETERMRADVALRAFLPGGEMASHADYFVVKEGLTTILVRLLKDIRRRRKARIHLNTTVADVRRHADGHYAVILKGPYPAIHADRVILTIPVAALRQLPVLRDAAPLRHLGMAPLTRIYARYPASAKVPAWFAGLPATVTSTPLRYVIPINPITGIIMISYTDDRDTAPWHGLKNPALTEAIQNEAHRLFPLRPIPPPLWVRAYEWDTGTTFWRPGRYDPVAVSEQMLQPRPSSMPGLYCAGESFSVGRQAWVEGALEHAAALWETHLR